MHPNPVFHTQDDRHNLAYARDRAFGVLAVTKGDTPLLAHIPFLLEEDGKSLWLHLVRSNPIARALKSPRPAKIAVSGPDSYISPDWYGVIDQVPTWNYVAVHLTGVLELRPQEELRGILDRQTAFFENRLKPKLPWKAEKMSDGAMDRMMRAIVPCRMEVTRSDGTWKLNQNKPENARQNAASQVGVHGQGAELERLAALMRDVDGQR